VFGIEKEVQKFDNSHDALIHAASLLNQIREVTNFPRILIPTDIIVEMISMYKEHSASSKWNIKITEETQT
jgi:hypothetical protein